MPELSLTKKVLVKDLAIQILIKKVEELTRRFEKLEKENKILRLENTMLKSQNEVLKAENAELRVKLESNSHNSNKPPSSDGYKKRPVKPAFQKGKGSSQGGQKGHKGHTLQQVDSPDKIVTCIPGICTCGREFEKEELMLAEKRQVFDLQTYIFQGIIHFLTENYFSILRRTHKMIQQYANFVRFMHIFALAHSLKIHFSPQAAGN